MLRRRHRQGARQQGRGGVASPFPQRISQEQHPRFLGSPTSQIVQQFCTFSYTKRACLHWIPPLSCLPSPWPHASELPHMRLCRSCSHLAYSSADMDMSISISPSSCAPAVSTAWDCWTILATKLAPSVPKTCAPTAAC